MIQERGVGAVLDAADRLAVEAGEFCESLLCDLLARAFGANMVPDGSTAGWYPVGHGVGWHRSTLVGVVIIVCTMLGTFTGEALGVISSGKRIKRSFE